MLISEEVRQAVTAQTRDHTRAHAAMQTNLRLEDESYKTRGLRTPGKARCLSACRPTNSRTGAHPHLGKGGINQAQQPQDKRVRVTECIHTHRKVLAHTVVDIVPAASECVHRILLQWAILGGAVMPWQGALVVMGRYSRALRCVGAGGVGAWAVALVLAAPETPMCQTTTQHNNVMCHMSAHRHTQLKSMCAFSHISTHIHTQYTAKHMYMQKSTHMIKIMFIKTQIYIKHNAAK